MSNIDKQALREAAERATESDWIVDAHEGWHAVIPVADAVNGNYIIAEFQGPESKRNRDFVAASNPATVLALLDELQAAEKRIAELEAREVTLPPVELVGYGDWPMFDANLVTEALRTAGINVAAADKGE
ncbi:TPA: ead/Ea22-like family protein [Enterobacter hormaechei subsp. steigerwaltii]